MAKRRAIGRLNIGFGAGLAALALAAPAAADVKDGVDAWSRGDFATAIAEWRGPADAGDADAQFNMGQAYRLGNGVPADSTRAEYYYARAAEQGHLRAADTYGLILFQSGRTTAALPYVEGAARRGDPRSQYLLGIAHFNGDIAPKDWVRAYALMTLANRQELPQAAPALAQMDQHIPLAQRQQGASLAMEMQSQAEAARAAEFAAFDLGATTTVATAGPAITPATSSPRVPQPIATTPVPASAASAAPSRGDERLAEARDAVRQAMEATGTENPGEAGADYSRPDGPAPVRVAAAPAPAAAPTRPAAAPPTPAAKPPVAKPPAAAPAPRAASSDGPWKLQLGAFGVRGNAEKLWQQLSKRPELSGKNRLLVPSGNLTRLLAGGFATRADANAACAKLQAAGQACIVTQ